MSLPVFTETEIKAANEARDVVAAHCQKIEEFVATVGHNAREKLAEKIGDEDVFIYIREADENLKDITYGLILKASEQTVSARVGSLGNYSVVVTGEEGNDFILSDIELKDGVDVLVYHIVARVLAYHGETECSTCDEDMTEQEVLRSISLNGVVMCEDCIESARSEGAHM